MSFRIIHVRMFYVMLIGTKLYFLRYKMRVDLCARNRIIFGINKCIYKFCNITHERFFLNYFFFHNVYNYTIQSVKTIAELYTERIYMYDICACTSNQGTLPPPRESTL
jgi:hypothetical protein